MKITVIFMKKVNKIKEVEMLTNIFLMLSKKVGKSGAMCQEVSRGVNKNLVKKGNMLNKG
jgi:hypothetical protein